MQLSPPSLSSAGWKGSWLGCHGCFVYQVELVTVGIAVSWFRMFFQLWFFSAIVDGLDARCHHVVSLANLLAGMLHLLLWYTGHRRFFVYRFADILPAIQLSGSFRFKYATAYRNGTYIGMWRPSNAPIFEPVSIYRQKVPCYGIIFRRWWSFDYPVK